MVFDTARLERIAYQSTALLSVACFLATISVLFYFEIIVGKQCTAGLDFVSTFYVAGKIVAQNQANFLYPPPGILSFEAAPFNLLAHQLTVGMKPNFSQEYLYMPMVARLFEPLAALPQHFALIFFQVLSFISLVGSGWLFWRADGANKGRIWSILFPMTFFPTVHVLWQGQLSIVFGIMPVALGYYLMQAKRPVSAGLAMVLTLIKPQYFILSLIIAATELIAKRFRFAFALFSGATLVLIANILLYGGEQFHAWLDCLKLADRFFSNGLISPWFTFGLPRQLMFLLPAQFQETLRLLVYGACGALVVPALFLAYKTANSNKSFAARIAICFLLTCTIVPLVTPHFFIYDLSIFVPVGFILLSRATPASISQKLCPMFFFLWVTLDLYWILACFFRPYARPIIVIALILEFVRRLWIAVYKSDSEAPAS